VIPAPIDPRRYAAGGEVGAIARRCQRRGRAKQAGSGTGRPFGRTQRQRSAAERVPGGAGFPLSGTLAAEAGADNSVSIDSENPRLQGQVQWDEMLGIDSHSRSGRPKHGADGVHRNGRGACGRKLDLLAPLQRHQCDDSNADQRRYRPCYAGRCCSSSRWER
jgi:hypothetical protein